MSLLPAVAQTAPPSTPGPVPIPTPRQPQSSAPPPRSSGFDSSGAPTYTLTGLPTDRPLRVLVYGDMRFTAPGNTTDTRPRVRKWLAERVGEENPDVMLLTGDMPLRGSDPADWQVYSSETASWRARHLRVFPTPGNHELIEDRAQGMSNYFDAFPQIERRHWYSVRMGNVYLISLDSAVSSAPGRPQRRWLEAQLAALPASVDFVFFLFHIPLMVDVQTAFLVNIPDLEELDLRRYLEAQAAHAHAKFVLFNGHIHNYERYEIQGIAHIISGGGGASPYPVFVRGGEDLFRARTYPNFHYLILKVQGKHAEAAMYRVVDPEAAVMSVEIRDTFALDAR